jgi:hypothetical protein
MGGKGVKMKKRFSNFAKICSIALLVSCYFASFIYSDGATATLNLSPTEASLAVNESFSVKVILNTQGNNVVGADIILNFNPGKLEVVDIVPNYGTNFKTFVPVKDDGTGAFDVDKVKQVANSTGKIELGCVSFDWSGETVTAPVNGVVDPLVTITYRAKLPGSDVITFGFDGIGKTVDSNVVYISPEGVKDILGDVSQNKVSVTITGTGDTIPPARVTTLSAEKITGESGDILGVKLSWLAPGNDGMENNFSGKYKIQYRTTADNYWNPSNAQVVISTSDVVPGASQVKVVTGLLGGSSYYFALWSEDEAFNLSEISNIATAYIEAPKDTIPPAKVGNLSARLGPTSREVILSWTAPGDDGLEGNLTGRYRIQYSTSSAGPWDKNKAQVVISTVNVVPGTPQMKIISNLKGGQTYYFVLWAEDEMFNSSEMSNVAMVHLPDTMPPAKVENLSAQLGPNSGEVTLWWTAPGDDGTEGNLITGEYRIQYSTIVAGPWDKNIAQVRISTSNVAPGETQTTILRGLISEETYYFVLWTRDDSSLWSERSNVASIFLPVAVDTTIPPVPALSSPPNGSSIATLKPTLQWNPVSVPFTVTYSLQVADNYDFIPPLVISTAGLTTTSYTAATPLKANTTYYWRVEAVSSEGKHSGWSQTFSFYIYKQPVTTTKLEPMPNVVKVAHNEKINLKIRYAISKKEEVELKIYTVSGELVRTLVDNKVRDVDTYEEAWDGKDENGNIVPSGIYLVYLRTGSVVKIEKIIIVK